MKHTPSISTATSIPVHPPKLMREIRKVMRGSESVQERLDDFTRVLVQTLRVEVASIYLLRPGRDLELSSTVGLNPDAVHLTRMAPGEGLVGHVALTGKPLNLGDAAKHPLFSYRPETGEEALKSFLGVPILRTGRTLGVLVVQSKESRLFTEEEVEDLLTVAMILAEITVVDERTGGSQNRLESIRLAQVGPETLRGKTFAPGLARGHAHLHVPPVAPADMIAKDSAKEAARLEDGIANLRASVDAMVSGESAQMSRASKDIFETYRMFAYDRKWVGRLREAVQSGLTAEAAVERVRSEHRVRLQKARDPYLRARLHDLEDLANRMLRALSGDALAPGSKAMADGAILFARDLGPAELLDYDRRKLTAIVVEEGSASSHTSIVCKALGIPLVGRCLSADGRAAQDVVEVGDAVLVDGEIGEVFIRPLESQDAAFAMRMDVRGEMDKAYQAQRDRPCITRDDRTISLQLNAGLLVDLPHLDRTGADGIGLFRTEFQFMVSEFMPKLKEQADIYRQAILAAGSRPVTFRTLDLGGDKILPYIDAVPEANPAIGWRAIRIGLDRPGLVRYQSRALLQAARGKHLRVMFPMVTTVDEFISARELFDREVARASSLGDELPTRIEVGVMLETPSMAWQINAICDHADFVSVGCNDLMQFFFAADRDNPRVSDRYDPLHPAALSIMRFIAYHCEKNAIPVSVCGEIAGRPLEACVLASLGFSALSMPMSGIGPVKASLLRLDTAAMWDVIQPLITVQSRASTLRPELVAWCAEQGVPV